MSDPDFIVAIFLVSKDLAIFILTNCWAFGDIEGIGIIFDGDKDFYDFLSK